ncbi:MAG: ACP S-malonyltransferase [Candidatus Eremiobacterota bacterium]
MNFACLFPGQGSQYVGMGKELASMSGEATSIFELADKVLGIELSRLCWEGPEEELTKTINTQPAIVTTSIAAFAMLREKGLNPSVVAGHSVGEYAALVAAGAISVEDALLLIRKRGTLMYEAGNDSPGSMAAIIGLSHEQINKICKDVSSEGICQIANLNCSDQVVISGDIEAVAKARELASQAHAKRVIPLNVSGAFHSPLMKPASAKLKEEIEKIEIRNPRIPVITNVYAREATSAQEIREALILQMESQVLWQNSIEFMVSKGIKTFVETGAGKVLKGLNNKINKDIKTLNIEDGKSWEKCINFFSM